MWTLVSFAIATAMRLSEICRIRWDDVDRKHKTVIIRNRKHPTKKQGNDQEVPLLPEAWALLPDETEGRIFPFDSKSVSTAFRRACDRTHIHDLRFHDLRHLAITRLFEAGYQIHEVAVFSGHRSWAMLKRYTHPDAKKMHKE